MFSVKRHHGDSDEGILKRKQRFPVLGWGGYVKRLGTTSKMVLCEGWGLTPRADWS